MLSFLGLLINWLHVGELGGKTKRPPVLPDGLVELSDVKSVTSGACRGVGPVDW
jgi:hypothetical protein